MARRLLPSAEGNLLVHPVLSLPLLITWLVASIAILASLCASCHRKPATKSSPSSPAAQSNGSVGSKAENPEPATTSTEVQEQEQEQNGEEQNGEEYIPPLSDERITELDAAIHGPIYPTSNLPAGSTSKRRLSVSLSVGIRDGLKEGLSKIKTKKESAPKGGGEESLWKKTIILGEKCKMTNGDEEERNGMELNQDMMSRNTSFASAETGRFSTSV